MCEQERSWLQWFLSYDSSGCVRARGGAGKTRSETFGGKLLNCLFSAANKQKTPSLMPTTNLVFWFHALKNFTSQVCESNGNSSRAFRWEEISARLINFDACRSRDEHLTDELLASILWSCKFYARIISCFSADMENARKTRSFRKFNEILEEI